MTYEHWQIAKGNVERLQREAIYIYFFKKKQSKREIYTGKSQQKMT